MSQKTDRNTNRRPKTKIGPGAMHVKVVPALVQRLDLHLRTTGDETTEKERKTKLFVEIFSFMFLTSAGQKKKKRTCERGYVRWPWDRH